jgi:hypothetical protein
MKKTVLINPTGLKGNEINERMKELMGIKPINENKSSIVVELTKKGPDGNSYAVIRENHEWYIKKTTKTSNLVAEDFQYIGGLKNKKSEAYPSYAQAIKHLNLKFRSLAEAYNYDGEINLFINDNLLSESGVAGFSSEGSGFSGHGNMEGYKPMEENWMEEEVEMTEAEKAIDEMMNRQDESDFPDLTGDGKVTRADILKGRGVDLDEELKGKQKKLDMNKNGKIDSDDFKQLRNMNESKLSIESALNNLDSIIDSITEGLKKKV